MDVKCASLILGDAEFNGHAGQAAGTDLGADGLISFDDENAQARAREGLCAGDPRRPRPDDDHVKAAVHRHPSASTIKVASSGWSKRAKCKASEVLRREAY